MTNEPANIDLDALRLAIGAAESKNAAPELLREAKLKLQQAAVLDALGAFASAARLRADLDIRNVQLDTLSHLFLEPLLAGAHWRLAGELWCVAHSVLAHRSVCTHRRRRATRTATTLRITTARAVSKCRRL